MNQKAITAVLLSSIIAFAIASWGKIKEWWQGISSIWKAVCFVCIWGGFIVIGFRYGQYYALSALIAGCIFLVIQFYLAVKSVWDEI